MTTLDLNYQGILRVDNSSRIIMLLTLVRFCNMMSSITGWKKLSMGYRNNARRFLY